MLIIYSTYKNKKKWIHPRASVLLVLQMKQHAYLEFGNDVNDFYFNLQGILLIFNLVFWDWSELIRRFVSWK